MKREIQVKHKNELILQKFWKKHIIIKNKFLDKNNY